MPSFLYSLKCFALTLCLCQCMAVSVGPNTCMRYMPTFLDLVCGSRVWIMGNVTNGPPSFGQHVITGSFVMSGCFITTSWHSPFPLLSFGIHDANWLSFGSILSLSIIFSLGAESSLKRFSISFAVSSR